MIQPVGKPPEVSVLVPRAQVKSLMYLNGRCKIEESRDWSPASGRSMVPFVKGCVTISVPDLFWYNV